MRGTNAGRVGALLVALGVLGILALAPSGAGAQEQESVNVEVRMTDFTFDPMTIEVPLGGTVTWIYDDAQCDLLVVCPGHDTVAEVKGPDGEPLWQSETIKGEGATFTATMTQMGEIPYICTIHQGSLADMDGIVNVVAAGAAPAPDGGTEAAPTTPSDPVGTLPVTGGTGVAGATGIAALLLVLALALRAAAR